MAASDAIPVPRKNTAWRVYFAIRNSDGTLITSWAGADSERSLDGGSFSDCTNEATEIGTSGCGYLDLTAGEMNADAVIVKITVTNSGALPLVLTVFPEESGDYRVSDLQKVDLNTIKTQTVTAAAGVTIPASIASPTNITAATGVVLAATTHTGAVIPTVSTLSGHTPQTGDAFARIGATGSGLTSLAPAATALSTATWTATIAGRIDAAITSRMATYTQPTGFLAATFPTTVASTTNITAGTITTVTNLTNAPTNGDLTATMKSSITAAVPTAAVIADAVWDEPTSGHTTSGTTGAAIVAAGSAGDPWSSTLPGAYGAGTAGHILGNNLNAAITSRSSHSAADVWSVGTRTITGGSLTTSPPTAAAIADAVWDELRTGHTTAGTFGFYLDAAISGISGGSSGSGTGARTVTITVNDGSTVLQNARVRLTEGANTYTGLTDVNGVIVFNLDDANYTVSITKSGYSYAGTTLVVDGTETRTYSMTQITPSAPDAPDNSLLTITCRDAGGMIQQDVVVQVRMTAIPTGDENNAFSEAMLEQTSDSNGQVVFEVVQGATYEWRRGSDADWTTITIDNDTATNVDSIIGCQY